MPTIAGIAQKKPANDARNSGTSSFNPCTMSTTMNGTERRAADPLGAPADPRQRASTSSYGPLGLERRLQAPRES